MKTDNFVLSASTVLQKAVLHWKCVQRSMCMHLQQAQPWIPKLVIKELAGDTQGWCQGLLHCDAHQNDHWITARIIIPGPLGHAKIHVKSFLHLLVHGNRQNDPSKDQSALAAEHG